MHRKLAVVLSLVYYAAGSPAGTSSGSFSHDSSQQIMGLKGDALRTVTLPTKGKFVANLTECPPLKPKEPSTKRTVHDLRPDEFSVIMAVGDSITAGCFAEGLQQDVHSSFGEWRGLSYAGGGDPGAITVPNLIKHYSPKLRGASLGRNAVPEVCFGPICSPTGWNSEVDRFNAARSGAMAQNLMHEIRDYLVPQLKKHDISDEGFKYMSFQIGSNDLCSFCLVGEMPGVFPGSPGAFEADVMEALEYVRSHIPNTVVNLLGVFQVSAIYNLTRHAGEYCSRNLPTLPHYSVGCGCALADGPLGDWYRNEMDKLQEKYNQRLLKIVKHYQELNDPSFAVLWQPAVIPLSEYPIVAVSDVDCFHPSTANHQRIAAGIWNRMTLDADDRRKEFAWEEAVMLRCLEDDDRLQTKTEWEDD